MRIAITTERFDPVSSHYLRAGLRPVPAPCIELQQSGDVDRARAAAGLADLIVVTSARTVEFLWPTSDVPEVPIVAVGSATAAAVESRGGRVAVTGPGGLADLVVRVEPLLAGRRVVFPHGAGVDAAAVAEMRALAAELQTFEVYRTQPVPPPDAVVDAVAFASPSAVEGWHLSRTLDGLLVGAIGATTARAVARRRPADVVAAVPSHAHLAEALAGQLEVAP